MDAKRFSLATLVGGIVLHASGYIIFNRVFAAFYAANAGSATGLYRDEPLIWAIAIGNLAFAALITYAMGRRTTPFSLGEGAKVGAIVGFLLWCTVDFIFYGSTNFANLTLTIVDPLLETVRGGLGGAAIGAMLRQLSAPAKELS